MSWRLNSARIVAIVFAFVVSSCQGSPPEQQELTPTESPSASPAPLGEWTDVDLERDMWRVGYGAKPKDILARGSDGVLIFTPETPKDHIATAFIELPSSGSDRSLEFSVDTKVDGGESCVANLQDQTFNVLATVPCRAIGAQLATAKVPASVKSVRVYFQSEARQPIRLPTHIRLSEQR